MRLARSSFVGGFALLLAACSLFVDLSGLSDGTAPGTEAGTGDGGASDSGDAASDAGTCTADLMKDPKNCGACGRDCFGGACNIGSCSVVSLAKATNKIGTLNCDESAVYFGTYDDTLQRKGLDSSPVTTLVPSNADGGVDHQSFSTALGATHAYFYGPENNDTHLGQVTKDGSAIDILDINGGQKVISIAADQKNLYFATYVPFDGGSLTTITSYDSADAATKVIHTEGNGVDVMVSDGQNLYIYASSTIERFSINGGASTVLNSFNLSPYFYTNIGTSSAGAAWFTQQGVGVRWQASDNSNTVMFDAGVQSVALDEASFYAALVDVDAGGSVIAVPLDGGAQTILSSALTNPRLLKTCPGYLAWVVDDVAAGTSSVQILAR